MSRVNRVEARRRRQKRVRKKIRGTPEQPRLCVFRSSRHIYAQIIDDTAGKTLVAASSLSKGVDAPQGEKGSGKKMAESVGSAIGERALQQGIKRVVFDRNGFLYHGRVKALSEAARGSGLEF